MCVKMSDGDDFGEEVIDRISLLPADKSQTALAECAVRQHVLTLTAGCVGSRRSDSPLLGSVACPSSVLPSEVLFLLFAGHL